MRLKRITKLLAFAVVMVAAFAVGSSKAKAAASISYSTHVEDIGWMDYVTDGNVGGTTGQAKRLEAIQIKSGISGLSIDYQAHVEDIGWMDWVSNNQVGGTTGQAKRLEAIRIKLSGSQAANYDIYYRAHVSDIGWMSWVKNGDIGGTTGEARRLEALQICIVPKGQSVPADISALIQEVSYETHVSDIGWMSAVKNGAIGGTTGQAKQMEAITIALKNPVASGGIQYNTHCQDYGWMGWSSDGNVSGTTGKAKQMEAIQIKLTGQMANLYDVYYRAHIADYGWLDWASNGQTAGSTGLFKRMEAIQIVLVKKGGSAPGPTAAPCANNIIPFPYEGGVMGTAVIPYAARTGIDVSQWQGNSIDWRLVKQEGYSFAIIRAMETLWNTEDPSFKVNMEGAAANGIRRGVYVYATAENVAEAKEEAQICIGLLKKYGFSLELPIAYDVESDTYQGNLSKKEVTDIILAFKNEVEKAGYKFMLYANLNWLNNKIDMSRLQNVQLWVAHYVNRIEDGIGYSSPNILMWQYASDGKVAGISGGKVNVDLDLGFF